MTNYEYLKIVDDELETIQTRIGKIKISRSINSVLATTFTLSTFGSIFLSFNNSKIEAIPFVSLSYILMSFYTIRNLECNLELEFLNKNDKRLRLSKEKFQSNN